MVERAAARGIYPNLITSAVMLTRDKMQALADAGLTHVQISVQRADQAMADRMGGLRNGHAKTLEVAAWAKEMDLPLIVNAVMHRQNLAQLPQIAARGAVCPLVVDDQNTTALLIQDIKVLRLSLRFDAWRVCGGSLGGNVGLGLCAGPSGSAARHGAKARFSGPDLPLNLHPTATGAGS